VSVIAITDSEAIMINDGKNENVGSGRRDRDTGLCRQRGYPDDLKSQ
jgi:hypothetical protein